MASFTAEQLNQLAEVIGPAIAKKIEDQMAPTIASYGQRFQQVEAANASLNAQLAQLSAQQAAFPDERPRGEHKMLDDRDFKMVTKFTGDKDSWDNYRRSFLMGFYKIPALHDALVDVIRQAGSVQDPDDVVVDPALRNEYRTWVFRFLSGTTGGEAQTIVYNSSSGGAAVDCGFRALALLAQRFDPRTPGRILQQWGLVLEPGKVKDARHLQRHVESWEAKRNKLTLDYGEQLSDTLSIAILAKMIPRDLQDIV